MKKIIYIARPYLAEQTLLVYEDGNKIDIVKTIMQDLNESIFSLMEKHDTYRVDLAGPKSYTKGLANLIQEKNANKFSNLEINII